jgi:hypothetical protein
MRGSVCYNHKGEATVYTFTVHHGDGHYPWRTAFHNAIILPSFYSRFSRSRNLYHQPGTLARVCLEVIAVGSTRWERKDSKKQVNGCGLIPSSSPLSSSTSINTDKGIGASVPTLPNKSRRCPRISSMNVAHLICAETCIFETSKWAASSEEAPAHRHIIHRFMHAR